MNPRGLGLRQADFKLILCCLYLENTLGETWAGKIGLASPGLLRLRFTSDSALISLRKRFWRAQSPVGQICNGFCVHFIKKSIVVMLKCA